MGKLVETRHYHGDKMHDHLGGNMEHEHKPAEPPNYGQKIFNLIVLLVLVYVAFHVGHAELTRNSPPVCLLGAHWNIWSGWACN